MRALFILIISLVLSVSLSLKAEVEPDQNFVVILKNLPESERQEVYSLNLDMTLIKRLYDVIYNKAWRYELERTLTEKKSLDEMVSLMEQEQELVEIIRRNQLTTRQCLILWLAERNIRYTIEEYRTMSPEFKFTDRNIKFVDDKLEDMQMINMSYWDKEREAEEE